MHARALAMATLFTEETIAFLLGKEFPAVSGKLYVSKVGVRIVIDKIDGYSTYREVYWNYDK